jgi:hypothetical protein
MEMTSKNHERLSRHWWYPLMVLIVLAPAPAFAQGARLQLDGLNHLSERSAEVVDVTIDPAMLQFASGFLSNQKQDEAAMKDLISGLTGVYVKSFEFDRDGVYNDSDVEGIRRQLKTPGWTRLVNIDSKRERELVEMYMWRQGEQTGGLAILVAGPRELTVVNIVGRIDLTKLGALQGFMGIPRIPGVPPAGKPSAEK